jgi:hypothetical protein
MSMASKADIWRKMASTFRKKFNFPSTASINWFPGHMTKGLRMMEKTLLETDLVRLVGKESRTFNTYKYIFRAYLHKQ